MICFARACEYGYVSLSFLFPPSKERGEWRQDRMGVSKRVLQCSRDTQPERLLSPHVSARYVLKKIYRASGGLASAPTSLEPLRRITRDPLRRDSSLTLWTNKSLTQTARSSLQSCKQRRELLARISLLKAIVFHFSVSRPVSLGLQEGLHVFLLLRVRVSVGPFSWETSRSSHA